MTDKVTLTQLKSQFCRLSRERQAEVLGMAKAFTYAQQTANFDLHAFIRDLLPDSLPGAGKGK
ncbi:MAG: hypothetical protein LBQ46_05565 [Treponema sp.]|jgi:hypothetical protein|nr:hypothetical protein [Treponema sp.]